jgi:photosystem II stability/assembly factor-like uncharacterized protein
VRRLVVAGAAAAVAVAGAHAARRERSEVVLARLVSPSYGVAVVSTADRPRVVAVAGRTLRDVTPPRTLFQAEDLLFADRRHGWFVSNDCAAGRALVHRTRDGGRSWRATPVRATNCAAGSALALAFADLRHGWLVRTFENAPGAELERTEDGGATWRRVSDLPQLGRVVFRTARDGWLARADLAGEPSLFRSVDGGRTWTRRRVAPPRRWRQADVLPDLPRFFGRRGVLPVTLSGRHGSAVAFYVTADAGATWRPRAVQALRFRALLPGIPFPRYAPTSVVSPSVWWVVTRIRPARVRVTTDGGRHWSISAPPSPARPSSASISGAGRSAWLALGPRLLASDDLGRSWRPLDVAR